MNILVLNAGSSTLKFQLIGTDQERIASNRDTRIASGQVERLGETALVTLRAGSAPPVRDVVPLVNQTAAVTHILGWLTAAAPGGAAPSTIDAVGHRVVHGGETFTRSVLVDQTVLEQLEETLELAPLHNPHNLAGIRAVFVAMGTAVPQVAAFDTAFHHTLPERSYLYPIPYQYYRRYHVRRYGFHGTSHRYVAYRYRQLTGRRREQTNLVTLHLGSGCSACAIKGGDSIDTSMGFTPLEGLMMGTRSGDLDPAILDYLANKEGLGPLQLDTMLNQQSGLLGVSGLTADMRELLNETQSGDRRAELAIDMFCYRARKYIGAYLAALNGADAVVFTGGIGANSPEIRTRICAGLGWLGLRLDETVNSATVGGREGRIDDQAGQLAVWAIPTDEELLIARDTYRVVVGLEPRY